MPNPDGTYQLDMTVDASCYSIWAFGAMEPDNPKVAATMKKIREKLHVNTDIGGIARYQGDNYQRVTTSSEAIPGNPWIICTLWLAQYDIAAAKTTDELAKALDILRWAVQRALHEVYGTYGLAIMCVDYPEMLIGEHRLTSCQQPR